MKDTANIRVSEHFDHAPLIFDDVQLAAMTANISGEVIRYVPGFRWWECDERRRMNIPNNYCGHVQRAWNFYWSIRLGCQVGNVVLGIGCGGVGAPGELPTDKFCGVSPHLGRYSDTYAHSHMTMDADAEWPFHDNKFGGVVFNHSFEHLANQDHALREALRVTRQGGAVCILQPCMAYNRRGTIDPTHTQEWGADAFLRHVVALCNAGTLGAVRVITHNILDTAFSFETVLEKL